MCVKLPLGDLNPVSCLPHPINTYTCDLISKRNYHSLIRVYLNYIKVQFKERNPLIYNINKHNKEYYSTEWVRVTKIKNNDVSEWY